jgi:hypothetical protein
MDFRVYHSKLYFVELQAAQSWTSDRSGSRSGPLLQAAWDRTGRSYGFHYSVKAIGPDFEAAAGFVNRTDVVDLGLFNRLTGYGRLGALFETYGFFAGVNRIWRYSAPGDGTIEGGENIYPSATLKGGWRLNGSVTRNYFTYDPAAYAEYTVLSGGGQTPFAIPPRENNQWGGSLTVTTPTFRRFTASATAAWNRIPIFREAAPGRGLRLTSTVDLRPTTALRGTFQLSHLTLDRRRDGSRFSTETIPRLKLEYQLTRALFVRFVGQYSARDRSPLVDRLGRPISVAGIPDQGETSNEFRMDWLFSYRPVPGTLFYLGYGSTLEEPEEFRFRDLRRTADGFFGKVSYLFRM